MYFLPQGRNSPRQKNKLALQKDCKREHIMLKLLQKWQCSHHSSCDQAFSQSPCVWKSAFTAKLTWLMLPVGSLHHEEVWNISCTHSCNILVNLLSLSFTVAYLSNLSHLCRWFVVELKEKKNPTDARNRFVPSQIHMWFGLEILNIRGQKNHCPRWVSCASHV